MEKYEIAIIGGGFAGLNLAVNLCASMPAKKIVILERLDRIGKKILVTGNGRGNITNTIMGGKYYNSINDNNEFYTHAITKYNNEHLINYFKKLGMLTSCQEGKVYPSSYQANSIIDILKMHIDNYKIPVKTNFLVDDIQNKNGLYLIQSNGNCILAKHVVFCCGGMVNSKLGCDGLGYKLIKKFNHTTTKLYPSLVQLKTNNTLTKSLKGIKVYAKINVLDSNNKNVASSSGDLLFTQEGLSGNSIFEISGKALCNDKCTINIEFLPEIDKQTLKNMLDYKISTIKNLTKENLLMGIINKLLGNMLLKYAGELNLNSPASSINTDKLVDCIKSFKQQVIGSLGFEFAQVTKGGVSTKQFDKYTFESKLCKNLYCIGEMLDVDGECGGYNLQWAYSSAMCCCEALLKRV